MRRRCRNLSRITLLLAAFIGVAAGGEARAQGAAPEGNAAAWSDDLPLVAGGNHLWLAAHGSDDDGASVVRLFHVDWASPRDDEAEAGGGWEAVVELYGMLSGRGASGLAAAGDRLWLLFRGGAVQAIRLEPGPLPGDWRYSAAKVASLPRDGGVEVVSSAAAGERLWVLMRAQSDGAYDGWAATATTQPSADARRDGAGPATDSAQRELDNLVLRLPRNYLSAAGAGLVDDQPPATQPARVGPSTQPAATEMQAVDPGPAPSYRLAVLEGGAWRGLGLPEAWEPGTTAVLVAPADLGGRPTLIARPDRGTPQLLAVFQPRGEAAWDRVDVSVDRRGDVRALRVAGQLVLVQHHPTADGFMARFFVVRGGRAAGLGQVVLDLKQSGGRWAAVSRRGVAAVAAGPATLPDDVAAGVDAKEDPGPVGPTLAGIDLQGRPAGPTTTLKLDRTGPLEKQADFFIMVGVVVVATLLLFAFWRRDPLANQLDLPGHLMLAPLGRRAIAGVIDLAPGLLVGSLAFRLSLDELYRWWPGRGMGAEWARLVPGLTAVAVTVLHTAILETLTARSLGKWATGLSVAGLQGQRPRAWQTLSRCGLKAFDLIAYLLLVLPVISPYRQRLGDMIASTVVVAKRPDAPDGPSSETEDPR